MYRKKTVLLGVTGGIAIYKACYLCSYLKKRGVNVIVIMTKNATEFVSPLTFETLTDNKVYVDTFARDFEFDVKHISLASSADMFLVAPATANFIAKAISGVADDMLTTTFLAFKGEKVIAPAMNEGMYLDEITQNNIQKLKKKGLSFIEPADGYLACGTTGKGRLEEPEIIGEFVLNKLRTKRDLEGKTVLVTAGGTKEDIDGVRYISNYSSGKMGKEIGIAAAERGAKVIFIYGSVSVHIPEFDMVKKVVSTQNMFDAVMKYYSNADIIIKAAAPCDFKPIKTFDNKIKDKNLSLQFIANPDIAQAVGEEKGDRILIVFAAETTDLIKNAKEKLKKKNADFIIANDLTHPQAGFDKNTNVVSIVDVNGNITKSGTKLKSEIADLILDKAVEKLK